MVNQWQHSSIQVRPVAADDLPQLLGLASLLDTVNLPAQQSALTDLVAASQQSFGGEQVGEGLFMFVAEDEGVLLGTASLIARHGSHEAPHYYLRLVDRHIVSPSVGRNVHRKLLDLCHDTEPWTELGGLVVHPDARGRGIGKMLVLCRLMLIAMYPQWFSQRLLVELLPPLRTDGGNAFWDALGGPLTGLPYRKADSLSRNEKDFITECFPQQAVIVDLLPAEAQQLIGVVGPATKAAQVILERYGFEFLDAIDPFDGGPHWGAKLEQVVPINAYREQVLLDLPPVEARQPLLVADLARHHFRLQSGQLVDAGLRLDNVCDRAGTKVGVLPLAQNW